MVVGGLLAGALYAPLMPVPAAAKQALDHRGWTNLLSVVVRRGSDGVNRVDYGGLKARHRATLGDYLAMLQTTDPARLDRADRMAFFINLYNAVTLDVVAAHYPVKSIRDINLGGGFFGRGPWKKKLVTVAGNALSLDDIEHRILRPQFRDPRIHYALNCASFSCPNLQPVAYEAGNLEQLLEAGARAYVNHPRGVRVKGDTIHASKIYDWYGTDFGDRAGLMDHWRFYGDADLGRALAQTKGRVVFHYDWSLNDAA